jgi:serine/threonine protein kinase
MLGNVPVMGKFILPWKYNMTGRNPEERPSDSELVCVQCDAAYEIGMGLTTCPVDGGLLVPKKHVRVGDRLVGSTFADRYEILAVLGEGGTSIVYQAKHLMMQRPVAIKVLKNFQTSKPQMLKRFQQEARAASALNHPRLVTVHDFGITVDGDVYIVMGYIEGSTLESRIQREGFIDPARAMPIIAQVCDGLAYAHAKAIVHRDIKPANIIFTDEHESVKIVDFGIAKQVPEGKYDTYQMTGGQVCGSPLFMSPEQCSNRTTDRRSDIYSLGATLYYMLVGHPPFYGATLADIVIKHLKENPRRPSTVNRAANISEDVDEIVLRCLQKDPDSRYQSIEEVLVAIHNTGLSSLPADTKEGAFRPQLRTEEALRAVPPGGSSGEYPKQSARQQASSGQYAPVRSDSLINSGQHQAAGKVVGVDHANSLAMLARKFVEQGDIDQGESLLQGAIALAEKASETENAQQSAACTDLADLYLMTNRVAAAEIFYMRALKINHSIYGVDHLAVADSMEKVGLALKILARYPEAENMMLCSLKIRTKLCSAKSEHLAASYTNLGLLYRLMNRLDEADYMERRATAIHEERLGETSIGKVPL